MKRNIYKCIFVVFICTFCILLSYSAAASPVSSVPEPAQKYITLVSSSSQEIVLDVHVDAFYATTAQVQDVLFQQIRLAESGMTGDIGKPALPVLGQFVAVPTGADVRLDVLSTEIVTLQNYWIYPVQKPQANQEDGSSSFVLDQDFYRQNHFYPQDSVTISAPQTMRGMKLVRLAISPLQFNPARREIRFSKSMRLRLTFSGGRLPDDGQLGTDLAFQNICQNLVINCAATSPAFPVSTRYPRDAQGAEYLIISASEYISAALTLAEWKIQRGIKTAVRTTEDTGVLTSTIKSYLQTVYDTWSPRPAYVLFLGDADKIPVFYKTVHPDAGEEYPNNHKIGTDLYYATMDGDDDRLPDLHLGRIAVSSLDEANHIVSKIIAYETNPPGDSDFYNRMAMATQFQDDNLDGREELLFTQTTETIRDYWLTQGYIPERIYDAAASVDPRWYNDGSPVPSSLHKPGFAWNGSTTNIVNAINNGAFLLYHRDHGWHLGWVHPSFEVSALSSLNNGSKTPVVFSINCESGFFDTETANDPYKTGPGFAEELLRYGGSGQMGAVGIFAATRVSWSWHNDTLIKGFVDSIWPEFLAYGEGGSSYRMGDILSYGKYYYSSVYGTSDLYAISTLELYHYHGDPTMEIWTAVPATLTVAHATTTTAGITLFTVNVEQDGALVSIVQNGVILGTAISSGGSATMSLVPGFVAGAANITVTKHNYRPYQSTITVNPPPPIPAAPSNLGATPISQTQIDLTWMDNSQNEDGFKIERSPDGIAWAQVITVNSNVTTYSDQGLSCGTGYSYRARAYNAEGDSDYSNEINAITIVCVPSDPGNLTATTISRTRINLAWTDNSDNESGFQIERSLDGIVWTHIYTTSSNITSYSNTGLTCDTLFYYRVRAFNAGGNSGYSDVNSATTLPCLPVTPGNLTAIAVSQTRIDLGWSDNSDNESGFEIERSLNGISWTVLVTVSANVTSYNDIGLACSTTYYYRVRAYNAGGDSAYSNTAGSTTVVCAPAAPTELSAAPLSQTQIALTWMDNSDSESGFKIERSPDGAGGWVQIAAVEANAAAYTDAGLSCGATYHYRVRAYNVGGDSAYSNTAGSTTVVCAPAAPTELSAAPFSQTQIALIWTDNSDSESGFKIERSPDGAGGWVQIAAVKANAAAYTDAGLSCGATYHYRVRAYNAGGDSAYSNTADSTAVVCAPAAPTELSAVPLSQTQIALIWTDNSDSESGFKIERSPDGAGGWVQVAAVKANAAAYTDAGLSCGATYHYRVRAYNAGGDSAYSAPALTTTMICTPEFKLYLPFVARP